VNDDNFRDNIGYNEGYDPPIDYEHLPKHLKNDPIHSWRASNGIELIHKEPSLKELNRIWDNWNKMSKEMKDLSDKKSKELFGCSNAEHYKKLLKEYHENTNISNGDNIMDDDLDWIESFLMEDVEESEEPAKDDDTSKKEETPKEEEPKKEEPKKESLPKQTDKAESDKNGVRRKKLYIAFIEWAKEFNNRNTFGSIFDKDAFHVTYPFVPEEMRYFYRLANPILCVLSGKLTFFPVSDLRKINASNNQRWNILIFAATENDMRIFNSKDKKVYRATDENGEIKLQECLGNTFDTYIQNMIKKGDILNAPLEESVETFNAYDIEEEFFH
jgi:hypothetical protein